MRRFSFTLGLFALLLASCGSAPEPPEGFLVNIRFISLDPAVIDDMRLRFDPPEGMSFEPQDEMTFEGGAIVVRIDTDGSLIMTITGAHVRASLVPSPDGTQMIYPLQIWSDDPAMNTAPLVIGSVSRSGEVIGDGTVFLPAWPPPLEASVGLGIQCTSTAAAAGRCTP